MLGAGQVALAAICGAGVAGGGQVTVSYHFGDRDAHRDSTAIAQHGGTLEYQSTPGIGTIATVALPIEVNERKRASA